jgi:hypothetical protein
MFTLRVGDYLGGGENMETAKSARALETNLDGYDPGADSECAESYGRSRPSGTFRQRTLHSPIKSPRPKFRGRKAERAIPGLGTFR